MLRTVPVKAAAALPAAPHGVEPPTHEQPQSRDQGRTTNATATSRRMTIFSQNCTTVSARSSLTRPRDDLENSSAFAFVDARQLFRYSSFMEPPIACTLTEAEMRERRDTILDSVRKTALSVTPLSLGYTYRFRPGTETLAQLARLIDLERRCCPFLTFRIAVESDDQSICLEITGPPGARMIIADLFGVNESLPRSAGDRR